MLLRFLPAFLLPMLFAPAALASSASAQGEVPAVADVEARDSLISRQEALLNVYRCRFGVDEAAVPGGCSGGSPTLTPADPPPFAGPATQQAIAARDALVAAQEDLLNVYRCRFGVDTAAVPGGCVGGQPAGPITVPAAAPSGRCADAIPPWPLDRFPASWEGINFEPENGPHHRDGPLVWKANGFPIVWSDARQVWEISPGKQPVGYWDNERGVWVGDPDERLIEVPDHVPRVAWNGDTGEWEFDDPDGYWDEENSGDEEWYPYFLKYAGDLEGGRVAPTWEPPTPTDFPHPGLLQSWEHCAWGGQRVGSTSLPTCVVGEPSPPGGCQWLCPPWESPEYCEYMSGVPGVDFAWQYLGGGSSLLSLDDAEELVRRIWAEQDVVGKRAEPPTVQEYTGRDAGAVAAYNPRSHTISLPSPAPRWVLLHETAHALTADDPGVADCEARFAKTRFGWIAPFCQHHNDLFRCAAERLYTVYAGREPAGVCGTHPASMPPRPGTCDRDMAAHVAEYMGYVADDIDKRIADHNTRAELEARPSYNRETVESVLRGQASDWEQQAAHPALTEWWVGTLLSGCP